MTQDIADTLDKAADLIAAPGAWTQKVFARNANGRTTGLSEFAGPAVCWCVMGATAKVSDDGGFGAAADEFFQRFLGINDVGGWNDDPERTQEEVVAKLREAAAKVRAEQVSS